MRSRIRHSYAVNTACQKGTIQSLDAASRYRDSSIANNVVNNAIQRRYRPKEWMPVESSSRIPMREQSKQCQDLRLFSVAWHTCRSADPFQPANSRNAPPVTFNQIVVKLQLCLQKAAARNSHHRASLLSLNYGSAAQTHQNRILAWAL